ncbi:hypothetical protein ACIRP0_16950 [Streptomyces sp. NPDC101733]|uniref:hypothetical protein n=1 Tax=unclassified Streptomyces TaxID=2593676 RepID=UPI003801188C
MSDRYAYVPHGLLRRHVRDIASGYEGELMAVIYENVSDRGAEHWMDLAYIRGVSGREFTTSAANVVAADRPGQAGPHSRSRSGAAPGAATRHLPLVEGAGEQPRVTGALQGDPGRQGADGRLVESAGGYDPG